MSPNPAGLYDIPLPNGRSVVSALSPEDLGMAPDTGAPAPLAGSQGTAGLSLAVPLQSGPPGPPQALQARLDAGGPSLAVPLQSGPVGPAAPAAPMQFGAVDPSLKVAPPEHRPAAKPPPDDLVRVGPSSGGIPTGGGAGDPTARDANAYAEYLMRGSRGSGGRVVTTPERDALRSFQIASGPEIDPEDLDALHETDIDRRLAAQTSADQEQAQRQAEVTAQERLNLENKAQLIRDQASQAEKEHDIQSHIEAKVKRRDEQLAEIKQMNVDPNRFFSDRGVLGGILAVIAMGFGGAQSGLTGGPNYAAQEIGKMVDRDIAAQEHAIANAKDQADMTQTDLGRLYAESGNLDLAKAELRQRQHAVAEGMAANYAKRAGIPEVQARYDQWLADDSAAAAKRDADFRMAAQGERRENWEHVEEKKQYMGGGGRKPLSPEEAYRKAAAFAKSKREIDGEGGAQSDTLDQRVRDPVTGAEIFLPEKQATDVQAALDGIASWEKKAVRQKELLKRRSSWTAKERAEYDANRSLMVTDDKVVMNLGALTESDMKLVERGEEASESKMTWKAAKRAVRGDWDGTKTSEAEIDAGLEDKKRIRQMLLQRGKKDAEQRGGYAANPVPSARSEE